MTDVVVAGHVTLDRYGEHLVAGGTAYYAARAYLALGARVRIVTAAARDFPFRELTGCEVEAIASPRTSQWTNAYSPCGERTQRVEAIADPVVPVRLPRAWRGADLLHLAPVLGEVDLASWIREARARFVGIGVQGWVRALDAGGAVLQPRWSVAPAQLAGVDAACLGEDDVKGQGDLIRWPRLLLPYGSE